MLSSDLHTPPPPDHDLSGGPIKWCHAAVLMIFISGKFYHNVLSFMRTKP